METEIDFTEIGTPGLVQGLSGASMMLGESVGWNNVATFLRGKSGEAYAAGNDPLAKILRDTADLIDVKAIELRNRYDKDYRPETKLYWAELLKRLDKMGASK